MKDYQEGKIYKIVSSKTDKVYIGSTVHKLPSRMSSHRRTYKQYQAGGITYHVSSSDIFPFGDAEIIMVESYPCASKYELETRERYWIERTA